MPKRPNILFCISDDQSWPHASAYGCKWVNTPAFDRIACEGILFNNAFTPNAKCAPSRAAILTGRYSWQLQEACNHLCFFPSEYITFQEIFGEAGYATGFTGKGWGPGEPGTYSDGSSRQLVGPEINELKLKPPATGINSINYSANFETFLNAKPDDTPFCFWYGGKEPHRGYEYGSGVRLGGKSLDDIDEVPPCWPPTDDVKNDMLDYAFEVEWFDKHLGEILDILEKNNELENTLIMVTSDNGMPFPRMKGQLYEVAYHMPLAAMWKGVIEPGRTIDDLINFVDFAPTFLEAAGIDAHPQMTGESLMPIFQSAESGLVDESRTALISGKERHDICRPDTAGYPIRGIRDHQHLYLRNFEPDRWPAGDPEIYYRNIDDSPTKTRVVEEKEQGNETYWQLCMGKNPEEELYNIQTDPHCINNLADSPEHQDIKNTLWTNLQATLKQHGDPRMEGRGHIFDDYPVTNSDKEKEILERLRIAKETGIFCKENNPKAGSQKSAD
ncbi:MAG: sulfatase [Candidatus Latescibacteria bacterium]|jgi:arylsulfatase A-like enzyme|nr:sulfatase [Candidatus Latescibacterota bacterium]